jgi:hypothetical protein
MAICHPLSAVSTVRHQLLNMSIAYQVWSQFVLAKAAAFSASAQLAVTSLHEMRKPVNELTLQLIPC